MRLSEDTEKLCTAPFGHGPTHRYESWPLAHVVHQLTKAEADTIRILVATDNHVGYEERDPIRKDDSWKTFDEILNLARKQDVCGAPETSGHG